jgi:hypothetical protein
VGNFRTALVSGEPLEQEVRLKNADGIYRWFLHRNFPLRDEKGNVAKCYGILFDIEELKNSETKLMRLVSSLITRQFPRSDIVNHSMCRYQSSFAQRFYRQAALADQ